MTRHPRVSTQYSMHRNLGGRLSCGADNSDGAKGIKKRKVTQLQNMPKDLRTMFEADSGFTMVGGDWSAFQWAICMLSVGSPYHLDLYDKQQRGELDPHSYLASFAYDVPTEEVTPTQRFNMKAFTFGCMFIGKEAEKAAYNLSFTTGHPRKFCRAAAEAHEKAFQLSNWWASMRHFVTKNKYVESKAGARVYHFEYDPEPKHYLAHYIQHCESEIVKWLLPKADEMFADYGGELLTTMHDSLVGQVPRNYATKAQADLKSIMESLIPWWGKTFVADVKTGRNWKEVS